MRNCIHLFSISRHIITDQVPVSFQNLDDRLGPKLIPRREPLDPIYLEDCPKDPIHPLPTSVTKVTSHAKNLR